MERVGKCEEGWMLELAQYSFTLSEIYFGVNCQFVLLGADCLQLMISTTSGIS